MTADLIISTRYNSFSVFYFVQIFSRYWKTIFNDKSSNMSIVQPLRFSLILQSTTGISYQMWSLLNVACQAPSFKNNYPTTVIRLYCRQLIEIRYLSRCHWPTTMVYGLHYESYSYRLHYRLWNIVCHWQVPENTPIRNAKCSLSFFPHPSPTFFIYSLVISDRSILYRSNWAKNWIAKLLLLSNFVLNER